jgi:hypothetical protein
VLDLFRTLPGLLDEVDGSEVAREAIVFAAWRRIAGDALAEHTVPLRLVNGKLSVAVSSITWQRQLKDLCGQMLFKLNAALGAPVVKFVELQIDEPAVLRERMKMVDSSAAEYALRREAEKEVSPELIAAADRFEDPELRKQFLLAAGNCLVRKKRSGSKSRA